MLGFHIAVHVLHIIYTVVSILIDSSSKKHANLIFLFIFRNRAQNPLLTICMTTLILQNFFHSVWHGLNKSLAVFFNLGVSVPNLNYGLYELGFCSAIEFCEYEISKLTKDFLWDLDRENFLASLTRLSQLL